MRDIKFRAWDKADHPVYKDKAISRMCYFGPDYYLDDDGYLQFESPEGKSPIGDHDQTRFSELMQYTGLKDKNGVEIYEGDIVNIPYGRHKYSANDDSYYDKVMYFIPCQIVFSEWAGFWPRPLYGKKKMYETVRKHQQSLWGIVREDEVIGNIYETPELLK